MTISTLPTDPMPHAEYVVVEVVEVLDPSHVADANTLSTSEPIEFVEVFMVEPGDASDPLGVVDPTGAAGFGLADPTDNTHGFAGVADPTGLADDPSGAMALSPDGDFGTPAASALSTDPTADATNATADPTATADPATAATSTDTSDQTAHADAAQAAQQEADADVASGDYAAASEARGNAENESYSAGDDTMLHGSSSTDLSTASTEQTNAAYDEHQESQAAASGDYAGAKEDAQNAAYQTHGADYEAGGSDHSGQAAAEADKEDWAVWHQGNADSEAANADYYAAQGDADHAATASDAAATEQGAAATSGYQGEHDAPGAVYDASSDVAHDTPVEDHTPVEEPAPVEDTTVHDTSADDASG